MVRVYNDGMSNLVDTLIVKIIEVCESQKWRIMTAAFSDINVRLWQTLLKVMISVSTTQKENLVNVT